MTTADTYPPDTLMAGASPCRYLFLVEGLDEVDALLRVLGPFGVQQAQVRAVEYTVIDGHFALRMEAEGLGPDRAQHLCRKLQLIPLVTSVSIGWRNGSGAE